MKKEKDFPNKIINLEKAQRVRNNLNKIKKAYKNDPEGLERLADKLRKLDKDKSDNAQKTCSAGGCVKGNGSFSESPLDARRECLPETCATDKNKME
jgi:hypothetical protein